MISLLNGISKLDQNVMEIKGDKNKFEELNLDGFLKQPKYWQCDLMISLSSMKKHAALAIASLDDYCAVIETPEGFRILCEPPHIPTHLIIDALEEVGLPEFKICKSIQNSIMRIDVLESQ